VARACCRTWEGLATVEQHGYAQCHHHAPLSALLLSAVRPVTLYTPTQPSTVPLQAGRCVLLSHRLHPLTARRPQRCNVNGAPYIRRCWCSSDARYVSTGKWGGFGCRIVLVRRGGKHLSAGVQRWGEGRVDDARDRWTRRMVIWQGWDRFERGDCVRRVRVGGRGVVVFVYVRLVIHGRPLTASSHCGPRDD
jgi:hypothetical protein